MSRTVQLALASGLALVTLLAGCATDSRSYDRTRGRWTRKVETYENFESRLFVRATFKTEEFRRAYADAYARMFALEPAARESLLEAELAEQADEYVFVVASFTNSLDWENLDPKAGIWDVRMENGDGRVIRPSKVKRLDETNPTWDRLFPYKAFHDRLYEFHFPKDPASPIARSGEPVYLVIAGAPAQVKLEWPMP
ncbi:MAG: hypothetical protein H6744_08550 [Deltaproteobacteria bacterium]|nr:hypothetical protein [Deltaproteobacteria bacterium]MCB9786727.1 hypothetical protein [Deltaproteobacteria bacterium]